MHHRNRILVALALVLAPVAAHAQSRFTAGVAGVYGQPLGQFGENVKRGFGADGFGTLGIDARGIFSLRGEVGYIRYNRNSEYFLANTGFGVAELESETTSGVLTMGVGPQLMLPEGAIRPYIGGTVGFARFATNTSINIPSDQTNTGQKESIYDETVSSDFILSLAAIGGVAFQLNFLGRGVLADLGVRWHRNGEAEYVSSEGVFYTGTGQPSITATRSDADFLVYRLGIVIPLGRGGNVTVTP
jgi:hypothetical protein